MKNSPNNSLISILTSIPFLILIFWIFGYYSEVENNVYNAFEYVTYYYWIIIGLLFGSFTIILFVVPNSSELKRPIMNKYWIVGLTLFELFLVHEIMKSISLSISMTLVYTYLSILFLKGIYSNTNHARLQRENSLKLRKQLKEELYNRKERNDK